MTNETETDRSGTLKRFSVSITVKSPEWKAELVFIVEAGTAEGSDQG